MIVLSIALNKAKNEKKNLSCGKFGSILAFRSIVRKKARNVFVMSLSLSDHKVLHNTLSSSRFFDFAWHFLLFSLVFRTSKFLEFKEFNKTIIPFALVGYETGYSQLGAIYVPSYIQQAQMELLLNIHC